MIFRWYLTKEFIRFGTMITLFFSLMYSLIDFLEKNARYFPRYDTPASVIFEFYLLQQPKMFVDILPFATLFASIITLWLFSRSGEIAAARAAGASLYAIGFPLFLAGMLLSVSSFCISEWIVPAAQNRLRYVESVKIEGSRLSRTFLESNWIRSGPLVMHFERYDRVRGVLRQPTLYSLEAQGEIEWIAKSPTAAYDRDTGSWVLMHAVKTTFPRMSSDLSQQSQKNVLKIEYWPRIDSNLGAEPPRILSSGIAPNELGFFELKDLIRESETAGISAEKKLVDLYQKTSMPLANVLFVFLAMPFAMRRERQRETYTGILMALGLALMFWIGNLSLRGLAQSEVLPPFIAAFLMSFVLLSFGIYQIRRLNRSV